MRDESGELKYRLFKKDDIDGVLRLWEEESGWGKITEEQFYKWYINTPFGECLTVLAVNENEQIVGQTVFVPAKIYIDGIEKKTLRVLAPIIAKEFRNDLQRTAHPFFEMYRTGLQTAIEQGFSVFYTFPIHNWIAVMRHFPRIGLHPIKICEYDCYALQIAETNVSPAEKMSVSIVNEFTSEYDELWKSAVTNFPVKCGIVRDAKWLNWKLGARLTFEARNSENQLLGYLSIDKKTSLMADALARTPEDLEVIFGAVIGFLKRNNDFGIREIKLMKTDLMQLIVEKYGLSKVDFKFAFGCYGVDLTTETFHPNRWYLMPND